METQVHVGGSTPAGRDVSGHGSSQHNSSAWTRVAALTGVVFAVALATNLLTGGNEPSSTASAAKVAHYYLVHKNQTSARGLFGAVAVLFGLGFFSYLRTYLRRVSSDALVGLYFTGVLVFALGGVIGTGIDFTLGDSPKSLSPDSLQTLNMLGQDLNWPIFSIGLALMYLAIGIIIVRSGILPAWVGWIAILLAVVAASLFFAFIPLILTPIWVLVVGIMMAVRNPQLSADHRTT